MTNEHNTELNALVGQPAEVRMTIHITRAATGKVETYELVGRTDKAVTEQPQPQPQKEE